MKLFNMNWMSGLDGARPLNQITIPGTHDSCTQHCTMSRIARCQHTSVQEQLENGFRFLDVRLVCRNGWMFAIHGSANCKTPEESDLSFTLVLETCMDFLKKNPSETILMSVKKDRGYHQDKFAEVLLEQYYSHYPEMWYLENRTPSLDEVRGKIVLLRRYKVKDYGLFTDQNSGLNFSVWPDQKSKRSTQGILFDMQATDRNDTGRKIFVQDRYSFPTEIKWNRCVLPMLESECKKDTWYLNFLSTMSGGCPERSAEEVNRLFYAYPLTKGCHGILPCDYGTSDLAKKIFATNF